MLRHPAQLIDSLRARGLTPRPSTTAIFERPDKTAEVSMIYGLTYLLANLYYVSRAFSEVSAVMEAKAVHAAPAALTCEALPTKSDYC